MVKGSGENGDFGGQVGLEDHAVGVPEVDVVGFPSVLKFGHLSPIAPDFELERNDLELEDFPGGGDVIPSQFTLRFGGNDVKAERSGRTESTTGTDSHFQKVRPDVGA